MTRALAALLLLVLVAGPAVAEPAADVFYVHPTTDRSAGWNQDPADPAAAAAVTTMIERQGGAFAGCCRLVAPRYRQATARAFRQPGAEADAAYDLAYGDVRRAFEAYLANDNHGRPFILAGHSQGALHVVRLLRELVIGRPVQKQLVAAYPVGIGLAGPRLPALPVCTTASMTGCIVSWNIFAAGSDVSAWLARSGADPVCNLVPAGTSTALYPGQRTPRPVTLHARCERGVLFVDAPPEFQALPDGSLHLHDVELLYGPLGEDALQRVKAMAP
jgi:hypothetical protein